ncbi:transcription cofactor vestigial-like protein 3 [Amphiura filiformis]|uniref:transcription cofactor vestigial-like protein 3 n=1 Tax=Amphiura filiformis TaxID=82378 RepID=UPI003B20D2D7
MSCLDVMYQSAYHHQPYQPYSFYQRHFSQKFGHYKMQDSIESPVDYTSPHHTQSTPSSLTHSHHHHHYHHSPPTMAPHTVTSATPVSQSAVKEEDRTSSGDEKDTQAPEAEYLNSRCVLFTYYTGEINKVVDDHFTRALSQPSSFTSSGVKKSSSAGSPSTWNKNADGVPPMCQRNFPPSFWNSNYVNNSNNSNSVGYPTSSTSFTHGMHHDSIFGDSYSSSLHHRSAAAAAAATDHWHHYPFSSSQGTYSHRSIHDLSYGMSPSSAFNPRYSSLLIQPPVRPGRLPTMPSQCDYPKSATDWPATYSAHGSTTNPQSYGIETASTSAVDAQDTSKDLYWF